MAAICLSSRGSHDGLKSYMADTCDQARVVLSSNPRKSPACSIGWADTRGLRTDLHVRKSARRSPNEFGDSYVFEPNGLFFVVNGRVRKLFPLRGGSG